MIPILSERPEWIGEARCSEERALLLEAARLPIQREAPRVPRANPVNVRAP